MNRIMLSAAVSVMAVSVAVGCGGTGRVSEIRTFSGDSLWQYLNGGAELYHHYNFIEMATSD